MSKPIAPAKGIALAFPDVCLTPAPPGPPVPIPYPNIAQLDQASPVSNESGKALLVGPSGDPVLLKDGEVSTSSGDEAGSAGGVKSGTTKGKCQFVQASGSVLYGPGQKGLVRFLDQTEQNSGNAQGFVLGAFPTVLVGD
jgi:hypothetical protein